jgi:hypothetical protein
MNPRATRHIVPPQARGYSDRSNRERRESRHPAIASRRSIEAKPDAGCHGRRASALEPSTWCSRVCLFWGRCRSCGSAVNAAGGTGRTTGGARRRPGGQGSAGLRTPTRRLRKAQPRKTAWRIWEVTSSPMARTRSRPCSVRRTPQDRRRALPRHRDGLGWQIGLGRRAGSPPYTKRIVYSSSRSRECRRGLGRSTTDLQQGHLPFPAFSRASLRCTKMACLQGFRDGETRTRTGDTTIFSRYVREALSRQIAGNAALSRRWSWVVDYRNLQAFTSGSGDSGRPIPFLDGLLRPRIVRATSRFTLVDPGVGRPQVAGRAAV